VQDPIPDLPFFVDVTGGRAPAGAQNPGVSQTLTIAVMP
jgi:hypothetical protein